MKDEIGMSKTSELLAGDLPEIPDDDADFTPDLARKIIAKYQELLTRRPTPPSDVGRSDMAKLADDIVQRLRDRAKAAREEKTGTADGDAIHFEEAASEIEHLRLEHRHACQEISVAVAERDALHGPAHAATPTDALYDSRNPNHGRIGGLRDNAALRPSPDPWVDTRIVRFDDTVVFGHGGFDFDAWDAFRWEMHTRHGSFAIWKSGKSTWSMYGGKHGVLALDRYASETEARADAEQYVLSLDNESIHSPGQQDEREATFGEDGYNPAYDEGITYAIRMLADLTGSKDWQMKDGSEDHESDVRDTIMDVLKCAGLYDDEDGKFAILASPTQQDEREAIARTLWISRGGKPENFDNHLKNMRRDLPPTSLYVPFADCLRDADAILSRSPAPGNGAAMREALEAAREWIVANTSCESGSDGDAIMYERGWWDRDTKLVAKIDAALAAVEPAPGGGVERITDPQIPQESIHE